MSAIVNIILPVFGIILVGYLCGRRGILGESATETLNRFTYVVALPALFIVSIGRVELGEVLHWPFLMAVFGGILITAAITLPVARIFFPNTPAGLAMHALTATFPNTGYMGIPLLIILFGERGALPAVLATVLPGTLALVIVIAIMEAEKATAKAPFAILRTALTGAFKSPLLISALIGLALSAARVELPQAFATFCDLLAASAAPCALFAMGLFMSGQRVTSGLREVSWLTFLKLLIHPLVTWYLAFHVFEMSLMLAQSAVILAALPVGSLVFVLAQSYGVYVQRATSAILVSTLVSVLTLSLLFAVYGIG